MEVNRARAASLLGVFGALVVLAGFSVAIDGFRWGLGNNALQAPILQDAVDPSLFPGDPFVATLDRYTSAIWWLLAQVGRALEIREWEPIIFGVHVATRVIFLAGLYALMGVHVRDRRVGLALVAVLALGASLRGASVVGVHGLMGRVPDHTALATAIALLAIAAALRARHIAASAFAALAFDVNAFVGVWLLPVVVVTLYATRPELRGAQRVWLGAAATYTVLVAPVAAWVFSAVAAPAAPGGPALDYRAFLREYFPKHFFIDSAATDDLRALASIVLVGVMGMVVLGRTARGLSACYASWIALFLLGAAAPYLTSSPSILNLHLLRMDAFLAILAAVAAAACTGTLMEGRQDEPLTLAVAVGILSGLATGYWWLTLAGVAAAGIVVAERRLTLWLSLAALSGAVASVWVLFDYATGNRGMVIASTLTLVATFLVTRASVAAAFALATIFSWTQQPKAVVLSFLAVVIDCFPLSDASRRHLLTRIVLAGTALLGFVRVTTTEHRLLLGVVIAALVVETWRSRIHAGRWPARAPTLGYAIAVMLAVLGTVIELRRPGPRDPFAAEIAAWRDVQTWARVNTRIDDVFAVPDWPDGFGVWAERSIWVDWKHGAAVMWDPSYHPVYRERRRVQAEATDPVAFARTTGVCFAVANVTAPGETFSRFDLLAAGLPVVFRNDRFAVVALCRDRARPGAGQT